MLANSRRLPFFPKYFCRNNPFQLNCSSAYWLYGHAKRDYLHTCVQSTGRTVPEAMFHASYKQFERSASSGVDPERPKHPVSSWIRFLGDYRKQHDELKGKEVMKSAAVEWKKLSDGQRSVWEKPYLLEKKIYEENFKAYVASGKQDQWKSRSESLKRDPAKPKKPMTPWLKYVTEYRTKNPGLKVTEATQAAAKVWKTMTKEQMVPYAKGYEEARAKYAKEIEAYKDSGKEQAWKAAKEEKTATKKSKSGVKASKS